MITEIKFACSHCGQKIAVESDAAGWTVECPTCQNSVTIPDAPAPIAPRRKETGVQEKPTATQAQAEIKSLYNERLALRGEVASHKQRAATAEAALGAMQGELDLQRQRLEATETQLAAAERELSESRAAAGQAVGERTAAEQDIADVRSELAAAQAAFEQMQTTAALNSARLIETEAQLETAAAKVRALESQCATAQGEAESLRGLMDKDEASREFLSTKTKLATAEEELRAHRQTAAQLEADLLASETERRRLDEERSAMHRRVAEALKQAEDLSKDQINADNEKLRELLERQNEELKNRFRELTRFRRAKLTLKIIWALAALGIIGLGYFFVKILPTIEWSR